MTRIVIYIGEADTLWQKRNWYIQVVSYKSGRHSSQGLEFRKFGKGKNTGQLLCMWEKRETDNSGNVAIGHEVSPFCIFELCLKREKSLFSCDIIVGLDH